MDIQTGEPVLQGKNATWHPKLWPGMPIIGQGSPGPWRAQKLVRFCTGGHIPLRTVFALGTQCEKKWDKQHEIYMANANILRVSRWG